MNQTNSRVAYSKPRTSIPSLRKIGTIIMIPLMALLVLGLLFGTLWVDSSAAAPAAAPTATLLHVIATGGSATSTSCTIANPCTLSRALALAVDGNEIRMAEGTYTSNFEPVLLITADITVTGGFSADDNWTTYDPIANLTILDAEENGRVVEIDGTSNSDAVIQGLDIRNGATADDGGGILVDIGATAVISNNRIHNNVSQFHGGGIYAKGNTWIQNNEIYNNAAEFGGGIRIGNGGNAVEGSVTFNRIYNNNATTDGGGIYTASQSDSFINGNSVYNNAAQAGGGFATLQGLATLQNNVFYKNSASLATEFEGGGGIFIRVGTATLWNNTIAYNNGGKNGGGLFFNYSIVTMSNNTVVSNTTDATTTGKGIYEIFGTDGAATGGNNNIHNNVSNTTLLTNTFDRDPQFSNNNTPNLRLSSGSPDINSGDSAITTVTMDIDQQSRPIDTTDVGADEFHALTSLFALTPIITDTYISRDIGSATFNHQLENIGSNTDTYTFTCSNSENWTVVCPSTVTNLAPGGIADLQLTVTVPITAAPLARGTTFITASTGIISEKAAVYTIIAPRPGISFTANITKSLLPGEIFTLTHELVNQGDALDNFIIDVTDQLGWVTQLPTSPIDEVPPGGIRTVNTVIRVDQKAAAGLDNIITIKASSEFSPSVSATTINTITAKPTAGDRYVSTGGTDTDNNCTVEGSACRTVAHAVSQARYADTVYINPGSYTESALPIPLLTEIQIIGGGEEPTAVTINADGGRLFEVSAIQPTIQNLTLSGGTGSNGGAVLVEPTAHIKFVDVIFKNNTATGSGGALYASANAVVTCETCEFTNNTSPADGGAVFLNNSTLYVQQSRFEFNTAVSDGGAIYATGSAIYGTNNLIANNNATTANGGGIYADGGSMELRFNTIADNGSGATGGGIYANSTVIDIEDTAITSNTAVTDHAIRTNSTPLNFGYNNLWPTGGVSGFTPDANNQTADPLFGDANYRVLPESPLTDYDVRDNSIIDIAVDFEDDFRPSDQGYDIGWDELAGCRAKRGDIIYGSIQDAVEAITVTTDFIQVTGICRGATDGATVRLDAGDSGLTIQGGWNGNFSGRDYSATYVDPEGNGRAFYINGADVTIELLTLINGDASGLSGGDTGEGAGPDDAGGAILLTSGTVTLNNTDIMSSTADMGGAIYNQGGDLRVTSFEPPFNFGNGEENLSHLSSINNNSATLFGGGIYNEGGSLTVDRAAISLNTATNGGGVYLAGGTNMLFNLVLAENSASGNGGGLYVDVTSELWHMSVYNNSATNGDGIYNATGASNIKNSIFESNGEAINDTTSNPNIDYNSYNNESLSGTGGGANSISGVYSGMVSPANGNYHLEDGAPTLDNGEFPSIDIMTDFDNEIRPSNQGYDLGADELMGCLARTNDVIYGNIQVALDAATDGGVIDVAGRCSGVHTYDAGGTLGTISQTVHITKNIHLVGGWDIEFNKQEDVTLLDAQSLGRVFYIAPSMTVTIENFDILAGNAIDGGAIYVDHAAEVNILGNNIYSNTAVNGAAVYSVDSVTSVDKGNYIYSNVADNGAVYLTNSVGYVATIQNNFFYLNSASDGAAIYNEAGNNRLIHNTVYNNEASSEGGAFYIAADAPDVRNNIFMDNVASSGGALFGGGTSAATVDYNDYIGNTPNDTAGTIGSIGAHSIVTNPAFVDAASADFSIYFTSTVVDKGDPMVNLLYDAEDTIRPSHNGMDMGAYEVGGCYARDIISPTVIFGSVQTAVNQAADDATIEVDGVCYGVQTITDTNDVAVNQNVFIAKPITIDGSWHYEFSIVEEPTALAPLGRGRAIYVDNTAVSVTVKNIILRDGNGNGAGVVDGGGAVYNAGAEIMLTAVQLQNNIASEGGAVYNAGQIALIEDTFTGNTAVSGGAVYNVSDGLIITTSTFYTNTANDGGSIFNASGPGTTDISTVKNNGFYNSIASNNGGAIYHANGRFLIDGNTIGNGLAATHGGAIYLTGGSTNAVEVWNNIIYETTAAVGGAIYDDDTNASIWHNTLYGNSSTTNQGGGIHSAASASSIYNNIVDGGSGQNGSAVSFGGSPTPDVGYNYIRGYNVTYDPARTPIGDIYTSAPSYEDPALNDYHLKYNSIGMDVGLGTPPSIVLHDIDDDPRPVNSGVDIGADEINTCQLKVGDQLFNVLQEAIDYAATEGIGEILMARGICSGVETAPGGEKQVGYIANDITIIGSLLPDSFTDPGDYYLHGRVSSRIDARGEGRAIFVASGATVAISQIAFVNGDATQAGGAAVNDGGGIYVSGGASALLDTSPICDNSAVNGGGLYADNGSDVEITGAHNGSCSVIDRVEEVEDTTIIYDTDFNGNTATADGGGMYMDGAFLINDHGLWENTAVNGGGVYISASGNGRIINGLFTINGAENGGGIYNNGTVEIYHNTIMLNEATTSGGGIKNATSMPVLNSSIIYANISNDIGDGGVNGGNAGAFDYNLFYDNTPAQTTLGSHVQTSDPLLYGLGFLNINSPAIDKADPLLAMLGNDPHIDYDVSLVYRPDGDPNHPGTRFSDIGAREYFKDYGCEITPENPTKTGVAGQDTVYIFNVKNTGWQIPPAEPNNGYTDTITITLNATSMGWGSLDQNPLVFEDMAWKESQQFTLTVSVPATVTAGSDSSIVACEPGGRPERKQSETAITNIGPIQAVRIGPSRSTTLLPSEAVTFTHTITNVGNVEDTYELIPKSGTFGQTTAVVVDIDGNDISGITMTLSPQETAVHLLRITALPNAAATIVDTAGATVQSLSKSSVQDGVIDYITIGAVPGTRYVSAVGGSDSSNCTDVSSPCETIQWAIDQAMDDDSILVAAGDYTTAVTATVSAETITQTIFIDKSLNIIGGYSTADNFGSQQTTVNTTTLDAGGAHRIVYITEGNDVMLGGLFIQHGSSGADDGGGIYNAGSNLIITSTLLLYNDGANGAALYHSSGDLTVQSTVIANNVGTGNGAGIYVSAAMTGTGNLGNNNFVNNSTSADGGAGYVEAGTFTLQNNIFASNTATTNSGIHFAGGTLSTNEYNLYHANSPAITATGTNGITADPLFTDGFIHISSASPAKDAGTGGAIYASSGVDVDSEKRIQGNLIDIGADELTQAPSFEFAPTPLTATLPVGGGSHIYTYILTNTSDFADGYSFAWSGSDPLPAGGSWISNVTTMPADTSSIAVGGNVTVTVIITGTGDGHQYTMVLTATSLADNAVNAFVENITTIDQATPGVAIGLSQTGIGVAGETVTFNHTITNTGSGANVYTLSQLPPSGWNTVILPAGNIWLEAGDTAPFTVTIAIPGSAVFGQEFTANIEAQSVDSAVSDQLADLLRVSDGSESLTILPAVQSLTIEPGQTAVYTHTVTNGSSTMPENVTLNYSAAPAGWVVTIDPQFTFQLAASASREIVVTVSSPVDAGNTTESTTITASGDNSASVQAVDHTTTQMPSGISFVPTAQSGQLVPGVTKTYTHTLVNWDSAAATIGLVFSQQPDYTVNVLPTNVTIPAGESREVTVEVTAPLGTQVGLTHTVTITATSDIGGATATAVDSSLVSFDIALTPGEQVKIRPAGSVITFSHTFTNVNGSSEIFDISASSNLGWLNDYNPKTVTLDGGQSAEIVVTMTVDINASPGDEDVTVLVVAWRENSNLSLSAVDRARAPQTHGVNLTAPYTQTVPANSTVTYVHTLQNSGTGTDSFDITAVNSNGWTVDPISPIYGLSTGTSAQVTVILNVPAAAQGTIDKMTVTATSIISTVHSAALVDTTIISGAVAPTTSTIYLPIIFKDYTAPITELTITPEAAAQTVLEGTTAVYYHTVTNAGNISEDVTMSIGDDQGWAVSVAPVNFTLAAGASAVVTVTVPVPASTGGQVDVATVTATGSSGKTAVAIDTTTSSSIPVTPTTPPPPTCVFTPPATGNPSGVDLLVTNITLSPANPTAGDTVIVNVTIKNQGQADMVYDNGFFLDFYINPNPEPPIAEQKGIIAWGIQSTDFPAGAEKTYSTTRNDLFTSAGDMRIWAQVDTDRTVNEANEDNNLYGCKAVTVSGTTLNTESTPMPRPQQNDGARQTPTPMQLSTPVSTPEPAWLITTTPIPALPPQSEN